VNSARDLNTKSFEIFRHKLVFHAIMDQLVLPILKAGGDQLHSHRFDGEFFSHVVAMLKLANHDTFQRWEHAVECGHQSIGWLDRCLGKNMLPFGNGPIGPKKV
jgi:hypothetical protein